MFRVVPFVKIFAVGFFCSLNSVVAQEIPANIWRVSSVESADHCNITKTSGEKFVSSIVFEGNCGEVHSPLVTAVKWVEDDHGNVDLLNAEDGRVASFASAEFDGMESVYPSYPMLTIEPVR